jgi:hypothetical protein
LAAIVEDSEASAVASKKLRREWAKRGGMNWPELTKALPTYRKSLNEGVTIATYASAQIAAGGAVRLGG